MVITTEGILFIVIIALVVGSLPSWPYSRSWGYAPTGFFSTILFVLLLLVLLKKV